MAKSIFRAAVRAAALALVVLVPTPGSAYDQDAAAVAEADLAAETRGDAAGALALYAHDAIIQYGGLCWTPCVGKEAIRNELERRVDAKNRWKVVGKYVSGNVAVLKTELQIGYIESSGVERVVVWAIYEIKNGKIAVATTAGERTDPETARFIAWSAKQPK